MSVAVSAGRWLVDLLKGIPGTYIDALRLIRSAWWIPLIAALPEMVQHIVEIQIGMFASMTAFKAHSMDLARLIPGGFKVAGMWLTIFVAAVYAFRQANPAAASRPLWGRLLIAFLINLVVALLAWPLDKLLSEAAFDVAYVLLTLLSLPLLVYFFGALFADAGMTLKHGFVRGWPRIIPMFLFAAIVFLPISPVHRLNHDWAIGAEPLRIWLLMIWDSALIGLMATGMGVGLARGYGAPVPR